MNEEQETVIETLLTKTPFHLPKGCGFTNENRNPSCSHAEIELLIQKRTITPTDIEIMKTAAEYPFVNHQNLRIALSKRLPKEYQKETYTDNLKKLKAAGILLCYRMEKVDKEEPEGAEGSGGDGTSAASPLRLYALSQSAFTYMAKTTPGSSPAVSVSSIHMVRMAAASQFALHFRTSYPDSVRGLCLQKTVSSGRESTTIDAVIHFFPPGGKPDEENLVSVILLSIREQNHWLEKESSRLRILSEWLSRQTKDFLCPVIVFCVEQISMALSLHAGIQKRSLLSLWEKYYCPDALLMAYPPLKALYRCENGEHGDVRAIRLNP